MIKMDQEYLPSRVEYFDNGKYTVFSIPETHRIVGGGVAYDGFISIYCKGKYEWHPSDTIVLHAKDIYSLERKRKGDWVNMNIYIKKVDVIPYARKIAGEKNAEVLDHDIPDDLF